MARLLFVNRFYWPDQSATARMLTGIATGLARTGHDVCVLTSRQITSGLDLPGATVPTEEVREGVRVLRVRSTGLGGFNALARLGDYLSFHVAATLRALRIVRAGDVIVAKTDPPMLCASMAYVARRRRAMLVNWTQDLFPEVALATGLLRRRTRFVERLVRSRNRSFTNAAMNVVLSEAMAHKLRSHGIDASSIRIIPNFADEAQITQMPAVAHARGDELTVMYAGNLGRVHEFDTLLSAGSELGEAPINWRIVGRGAQFDHVRQQVAARQLTRWQFLSPVPDRDLAALLVSADVHVVTLQPALEGLVVPSKLYAALAAAKPVVYIGGEGSDISRLLDEHQAGLSVSAGDATALADALRTLAGDAALRARLGHNARQLFDARFTQGRAVQCWQTLLRELTASAPALTSTRQLT